MSTIKNCFTVKELFDSTNINDWSCERKLARINRMLRLFYEEVSWLTEVHFAEWISLHCWINTINTQYPIVWILWFYWEWCSCIKETETCQPCDNSCSEKKIGRILLNEWWYHLKNNQYRLANDCNDTVYVKVKETFSNAYIYYKRWHKQVNSLSDEICMPDSLRTWFEYYVEAMYALKDWEINKHSVFINKFERWLKTRMDNQSQNFLDVLTNFPQW